MGAETKIAAAETLLGALAKALPELGAAKKSAENPAFKQGGKASKYADLSSVIEAVRPIAEHGIWFRQVAHESEAGVCVETFYIGHGDELSAGRMFVPADRANAQGYGSAQTYARRYGLQLAFGLATEDDDGNAASAREAPKGSAEGQGKGTVSPGGPDEYAFPGGPARNITELKTTCRGLWREIEGCGDNDELNALLDTTENRALLLQLSNLENPSHRQIWDGDGKDNPGIAGLITRKQTEFAQWHADIARA